MTVSELTIRNEKGLHARASALFVETVESFDAAATVSTATYSVAGNSIMGLLMLAASKGTQIKVETEGPEAEALLDALTTLLANKFSEESD